MKRIDLRAAKRDHAIYSTLCKMLGEADELTDLNFTVSIFCREAKVSRSTIRRRIRAYEKARGTRHWKLSAWMLLRMTDGRIKNELQLRRQIQKDLKVTDSTTDFFTQCWPRWGITRNTLPQS